MKSKIVKDLFDWQMGRASYSTTNLFRAINTADKKTKEGFRNGFPELMEVYDEWFNFPGGSEEFFKKYGFKL